MCGIAGLAFKDVQRPATAAAIAAMLDALAHRGPDDEGCHIDGCMALGHRRLSIIDLSSAGRQPMWCGLRRRAIILNGEIYNYLELRRELERLGRSFATHTDTEVVLQAFDAWGEGCVARFNGMWALAIWDAPARRLFLSRDRLGIKPLAYVDRPDVFAFASEMKAILALLPNERRVSPRVVHHFLTSGAVADGPETFFEGIRSFPPAHNGTYDLASGRLELRRYWDLDPQRLREAWREHERDPVGALRGLLESSLDLHQRSDVPVGACLSGGLDSSTIVCMVSARRREPVHTFSGLYEDRDCNEEAYVDLVNARARAIPCPVRPAPGPDFLEELERLTWHQDIPTSAPGLYTQYHVMRRASADVKVVLDGQGGDEVFAGYLSSFGPALQDLAACGFGGRLRAALLILPILRHWGPALAAAMLPQALGAAAAARARSLRDRVRASRLAGGGIAGAALVEAVGDAAIVRDRPATFGGSRLNGALHAQVSRDCLPAFLHYEDRNSMAFSIEARVPLLDHRIVEFAFSRPPGDKIRGAWTRWMLRKAAEPWLPPEVAWRRSKLGYPTPFARWLRGDPVRRQVEEAVFSQRARERGIVDQSALRRRWNAHRSGRADHGVLLWRLITLELWHRLFIDGAPPAAPARARSIPAAAAPH